MLRYIYILHVCNNLDFGLLASRYMFPWNQWNEFTSKAFERPCPQETLPIHVGMLLYGPSLLCLTSIALFRARAAWLLGRTLRDSAVRPVGARVARDQIYTGLGTHCCLLDIVLPAREHPLVMHAMMQLQYRNIGLIIGRWQIVILYIFINKFEIYYL